MDLNFVFDILKTDFTILLYYFQFTLEVLFVPKKRTFESVSYFVKESIESYPRMDNFL